MTEDPHDDLSKLESAIHHLKEAEQLHNPEKYVSWQEEAAIGKVDKALDEIKEYVEQETKRVNDNNPFK